MEAINAARSVSNSILLWIGCVVGPNAALNKLSKSVSRKHLSSETTRIWVCSSIIGAFISWPVQRLYGIQWNDLGFQIPALFINDFSILSGGIILHIAMKLHKLKSEIWRTVEAYVIVASAYTPILSLLDLPASIKRLSFEQFQLSRHLPAIQAFEELLTPNSASNITLRGEVANVLSNFTAIISLTYLVILAEHITTTSDNGRSKVYSALALAMTMSMILWIILVAPFVFLNEYSSIKLS